jgi:hypothetical protein
LCIPQAYSANTWWWFEKAVGVGTIKMGLPGIACQGLFLAPMNAMPAIKKDGVGALPLLPYSSMALNGMIWMTYGLVQNNPGIWLPNVTALICGSYYWYTYNQNCPDEATHLPGTKSNHVAAVGATAATVIGCATLLDTPDAITSIGVLGDAICIAMFGGPLMALKTVGAVARRGDIIVGRGCLPRHCHPSLRVVPPCPLSNLRAPSPPPARSSTTRAPKRSPSP